MTRSARQYRMLFLSLLFAAAPFAFALIRFGQAQDSRMLWMAVASLLGTALVRVIAEVRGTKSSLLASAAAILFVATLFAGIAAYILGATAAFGVWAVSFVLGLCWAASHAFLTLSRLSTS